MINIATNFIIIPLFFLIIKKKKQFFFSWNIIERVEDWKWNENKKSIRKINNPGAFFFLKNNNLIHTSHVEIRCIGKTEKQLLAYFRCILKTFANCILDQSATYSSEQITNNDDNAIWHLYQRLPFECNMYGVIWREKISDHIEYHNSKTLKSLPILFFLKNTSFIYIFFCVDFSDNFLVTPSLQPPTKMGVDDMR